jgi:hypothetical protein
MAWLLGIFGVGLWLQYIIPDKPPEILVTISEIPSNIKDSIKSKTNPPPSVENYQKTKEEMRKKYGVEDHAKNKTKS